MNIFKILQRHVETHPKQIAISDERKSLSYEQLWKEICRLREAFHEKGIDSFSRVVLQMENKVDWILAFLTLLSLRSIVIPLSPTLTKEETKVINRETAFHRIINNLDMFTDHSSHACQIDWPTGEEDAIYHITSGSTGTPKFCIRTHAQLVAEGISYCDTLELTPKDHIINVLPLYHSYALGFACMGGMVAGATVTIGSTLSPRWLLKQIEQTKATVVPLVPTIARNLTRVFAAEPPDVSSVRIWMVGAGKVLDRVARDFQHRFGGFLLSNYGSTETGGIVSRLTPVPANSVGKPMKGVHIQILDEHGNPLPPNHEGYIHVRCDSLMRGYLHNNQSTLNRQGFYPMGDMGFLDEEGYLYITGRVKNIISIGGRKVNPIEVEDVILLLEEVTDVAVTAVERDNGEPLLKAYVVQNGRLIPGDVLKHCKQFLSEHKVPATIEFLDSLPRNQLGKIAFHQLYTRHLPDGGES